MARREPIIPPQCDIMIPVTVTFYGDVGFDRSYNHVIDFSNETERDAYFSPRILKTVQNCAYNKPMNSIQLKCSYTEALNFTYCKFTIGSNVNSNKKIYAWVDDVVLITDQKDENDVFVPIIQINIAIDPWQTFLFDFTLGESFVAREHRDRFKANADGTRGWCLPNTTDDNSVGVSKRLQNLCDLRPDRTIATNSNILHYFISKVYWLAIQRVRTITSGRSIMDVLLVPVTKEVGIVRANGSNVSHNTLNIQSVYSDEYLQSYNIDPETVASVHLIPFDIADYNFVSDGNDSYTNITLKFDGFFTTTLGSNNVYLAFQGSFSDDFPKTFKFIQLLTINDNLEIPVNNSNYNNKYEPQLYKAPFKTVSIIDENGVEVGKLPDICANVNGGFNSVSLQLLIDSVDIRARITPIINGIEIDSKYWIEFPATSVEVIRSNWLSFLLQERETTREMISSQINQQAIASAIGGVSSAVGMGGQQAMGVGKAQAVGSNAGAMLSEAGGFGAGALVGLGVGAIGTVGNYVANQHFMFEQQDIREKAIKRKANNITQSGTFKSLIGNLRIVRVVCDDTTLDIKAKEFHKYGYSVFFYETPNLKSRKYFNFIATNIVKIEGSLNNNIKIALMEIFNNGVTIWHGDYISELTGIGDYSKENIERSLMS